MTILIDPVERDEARYADEQGELERRDEQWETALKEIHECLRNGGTLFKSGSRWMDEATVQFQTAEHEYCELAIKLCISKPMVAAELLVRAREAAVRELIDDSEREMEAAFHAGELSWEE